MSYSWRTRADVLNDLGSVNGRRTGAEHLDQHVVEGERPPPILHEVPDEEEIHYLGRQGGPSENNAGPDLAGISVMLKMVHNMDETQDDEPMTLYHRRDTDEICISKLNPFAGEYIPGSGAPPSPRKPKGHANSSSNVDIPRSRHIMPVSNMFRPRSEKTADSNTNDIPQENVLRNYIKLKSNLLTNALPRRKSDELACCDDLSKTEPNSPTDGLVKGHIESEAILPNMLPKRKIEKHPISSDSSLSKVTNDNEKIGEIKEKIKSTLIASANDNSIHIKRQKNVAIAALLKVGSTVTEEKPVELIKPEFFQNPPEKSLSTKQVEQEPASSSSDLPTEPDSIAKVNGWFRTLESPKPKQLPEPPVLKPSVTFKKKENARVNSPPQETKGPIKKAENKTFKPSSHASDLLKKYESNAQRAPLREDLGTMLERQLKEKDEIIKQKMLARQNAG